MFAKELKKIVDTIKQVKKLRLKNDFNNDYRFSYDTNTLFVPLHDRIFSMQFKDFNNLEEIEFDICNEMLDAYGMFYGCTNLKKVIFTAKLNLSCVNNLSGLFYGCSSLTEIDLSDIIISDKLMYLQDVFFGCTSLKLVDFGNSFHSENIISINHLFHNCNNLETINWKDRQLFDNLNYMNNAFYSCRKLKQVDLRGVNFNNILESVDIFYDTSPNLEVLVNNTFKDGMYDS